MTMTLERALDVLRVVTSRAMQGSETRDAYDCVVSHLTQPAQSVDVEKVRRVAADIRHWNEAICHPALNVFADKLEAALQEKGNGA